MILILTDSDYVIPDTGNEYLGYLKSQAYYESELVLRYTGEYLKVIANRIENPERQQVLEDMLEALNVIWGDFK